MQEQLGISYSTQCDNMIDQINSYVASITNLKADIDRLYSMRSLAVIHLNQYRQDYELLHNAYKTAYDWMTRNTFQPGQIIDGQQQNNQSNQNSTISDSNSEKAEQQQDDDEVSIQRHVEIEKMDKNPTTEPEYKIIMENSKKSIKCELKYSYYAKRTLTCLTMTKDNKLIAFSDGNSLDVISTEDSSFFKTISFPADDIITEHTSRAVAFSNNDEFLASSFHGKHVAVYKMPDYTLVATLKKHSNDVTSILFTKNNKYMITSGQDGQLNVWHYPSFEHHKTINPMSSSQTMIISAIAEINDGKNLLAAYANGNIALLSMSSFKVTTKFQIDTDMIMSISASPFDNVIATCSKGDINLWKLDKSLELLATLEGHKDMVLKLSFSRNNTIAVSGSKDENIIVWNYSLPEPKLFEISMDKNTVFDICHSSIDNHFASCCAGGYVCYWEYTV